MTTLASLRLTARRWICFGGAGFGNLGVSSPRICAPIRFSLAKSSALPFPVTLGRCFASSFPSAPEDPLGTALLDLVTYESVSSDTLESLCEYFDRLVESAPHLKNADITFSDGVLTVQFGSTHGTYVINRQSPNRQIWLSSPTSGPKRYDFVPAKTVPAATSGSWVYKHTRQTLHELLDLEIGLIVRGPVDFRALPFGGAVA